MNFICETFVDAAIPEVIIMGFVPMLELESEEKKSRPFKFKSVNASGVKIAGCSEDGFIMLLTDENNTAQINSVIIEVDRKPELYILESGPDALGSRTVLMKSNVEPD